MLSSDKKLRFIINVAYVITIIFVIFCVMKYIIPWTMPFILGFLIVFILQPIGKMIQKRTAFKNRTISFILVAFFYAVMVVLLWILIAAIIGICSRFIEALPMIYASYLQPLLEDFNLWIVQIIEYLSPETAKEVSGAMEGILQEFTSLIGNISAVLMPGLTAGVRSIPTYLLLLIFTIMLSVFISFQYENVTQFLYRQLPQKGQDIIIELRLFLSEKIAKLGRAYLIIIVVTFVEVSIGLLFLGVEKAIAIAFIIAILDILPVIGSGTILIPWAIVRLFLGDYYLCVGLLILYSIVTIVRNIIEPKIVGEQIGLNPIVSITAMYAGLKLFGFLGFFLAPITALFIIHLHQTGHIKIWK